MKGHNIIDIMERLQTDEPCKRIEAMPAIMTTIPRHQKRLIRAVYPNGSDKRGYRVFLTMREAKQFAIPDWLTRWVEKLTPQRLGGY